MNRVASMGSCKCCCSGLIRAWRWIEASIGKMNFLHKHSTFVQPALCLEHLGSSKHSDFQQQGFGNCWGTE
jgi:hypothetical protein